MALEKIILKKGSSTAETYTKGAIDTLLSGKQAAGNYQPAGNYATLGNDGKVPSSQLPSYVDDVLEYNSRSAFPATGEAGKIYIAKDTNKTYRWSGSDYVEISASLALGETSSTAYPGNKGKANADAITALQTGKADKATTLSGYGITDAYTTSQVDNAIGTAVPKIKIMTTYTAYYAISDGEIEIFLKNNNGTGSKQLKITPTSVLWDNQALATRYEVEHSLDNYLLKETTDANNNTAYFSFQNGILQIGVRETHGASTPLKIDPDYVTYKGSEIATLSDIPDVSNKANHTVVDTSADGKTITFTFD